MEEIEDEASEKQQLMVETTETKVVTNAVILLNLCMCFHPVALVCACAITFFIIFVALPASAANHI
jgi:hypothetical protein